MREGILIRNFRHKGLRRFFESGSLAGIMPPHASKLSDILTVLNVAKLPGHGDFPGFRLHPLKGGREGQWAVSVSGNWRVTFAFDDQSDVVQVDYEDHH